MRWPFRSKKSNAQAGYTYGAWAMIEEYGNLTMIQKILKEFREFAVKGNVVDLAVGLIIGGAFTKIVSSLVNDIIMPPIGLLLGGIDFSRLFINLSGTHYSTLEAAKAASAATLNYGMFINTILDFLIVSFAVFIMVKQINRMKFIEATKPVVAPPRQEVLLEEIRDLLKAQQQQAAKSPQ